LAVREDLPKAKVKYPKTEVDSTEIEYNIVARPDARRIELIDEIRGICVLAMVIYHMFFVCGTQFGLEWGTQFYESFRPAQPAFAGMFIVISGFCARLSRDAKKRGFILAVLAMAITFITVLLLPALGFENTQVWFGVLHLLAASMLLFGFGKKLFDKIPAPLGVILCLVLFFIFAPVSQGYLGMFGFHAQLPEGLYQTNALAFLGFHAPDFVSTDYFPLLPYMFLFFFGSFMGRYAEQEKFPDFCYKKHMLFFGFLGRHALPIYLLHVPVFYGLVYFFQSLFSVGKP